MIGVPDGGMCRHNLHSSLPDRCDSSIACRLCRLELFVLSVACLRVFVNCLVKQFAIFLGVVVILLLNVMEVVNVCGGALLNRQCMVFQRMCVLCL